MDARMGQVSGFRGWSLRFVQRKKQKNEIQLLRLLQAEFQVWCWCLETVLSFELGWGFIQAAQRLEIESPAPKREKQMRKMAFAGKKNEKRRLGVVLGGSHGISGDAKQPPLALGLLPSIFPVRHFGLRFFFWLVSKPRLLFCPDNFVVHLP
jgi:hypothetical protein